MFDELFSASIFMHYDKQRVQQSNPSGIEISGSFALFLACFDKRVECLRICCGCISTQALHVWEVLYIVETGNVRKLKEIVVCAKNKSRGFGR